MVGNKKTKEKMKTDLKLFLGENTSEFVDWYILCILHGNHKVKGLTLQSFTKA